jgi:hypothetical protein
LNGIFLQLQPYLPKDLNVSYLDFVIGAAIFDLSGLPKEYFTTSNNSDISWVQTIFQALGLQSLLMFSLQLENCRYVIIHSAEHRAIVVKQKTGYTALLVQRTEETLPEAFVDWAQDFQPATLTSNSRFSVV